MLKEILPVAWRAMRIDDTPLPLLRKAWEQGIMNADIPAEYGGQGRGLLDNVLITEELAAGCAGLATRSSTTPSAWSRCGCATNPALKTKILPRVVRSPRSSASPPPSPPWARTSPASAAARRRTATTMS